MSEVQVSPRIRGFICTTAHPVGCAANVARQIEVARSARTTAPSKPYRVLILGASTGYGLAGRIAATYRLDAQTIGVFYEKPGEGGKTGSPGWYNTVAFDAQAKADGHAAFHINGDAFATDIKNKTIATIREQMGQVDLVIYSLAAPRRTDPDTGIVYSSVLKPIGEPFVGKSIDLTHETVGEVTIAPATTTEVFQTVNVMGGDDLRLWVDSLLANDALAPGARVIPLSYIGPEVTAAIYRNGTIGRAKEHLEAMTLTLDTELENIVGGRALISVNKAVVTQASAAIPTVPLYYSLLTRILRERGEHEEPIHQMVRLLHQIAPGQTPRLDMDHRIRLDNHELAPEVQDRVRAQWESIQTENLRDLTDYDDYKRGFRQLFGFEVDGIDYEAPVEVERPLPLS